MTEIKKILVPVDFSANSEKLFTYAAFFAERVGAPLFLLNVIENPMAYDGFVSAKFDQELKTAMEKKMRKLIEVHQEAGGRCESEVVVGDTVDTILAAARGCDLIVIGTHGYRGMEKILMGSVAERVVKNAPCPVLVFNPYR
jgi:nucleotide-binding universal stress UspA family protein